MSTNESRRPIGADPIVADHRRLPPDGARQDHHCVLWTLRYPPRAHAPTDPAAWCDEEHGPTGGWRRPGEGEERERQLEGDRVVVDVRHERMDWGLEPGTRLRLDAVRTRLVSYLEDQPTPWGFLGGN